jgi:hypothetical protein
MIPPRQGFLINLSFTNQPASDRFGQNSVEICRLIGQ